MAKLVLSAFILGSSLMMTSCLDFKQDPTPKLPSKVGGEPDGGPGNQKPGQEQIIRPDLLDAYDFTLNVENSFVIDGIVLAEDYELNVEIKNPDDFPGYRFDSAAKTFFWTATSDVFGSDLKKRLKLIVRFIAEPKSGKGVVYLRDDYSINIDIARAPGKPEITNWSSLPAAIQEGQSVDVWFDVLDNDAGKTEDTFPSLVLNNQGKGNEVAPFINVYSVEQTSANLFRFHATLDLSNVEVTTDIKDFEVTFAPRSKPGIEGNGKTWQFSIFTSLTKPVSTWTSPVEFKAGETRNWGFLISDSRGEGSLETDVNAVVNLPVGATLACSPSSDKHTLACNVTWTPSAEVAGQVFKAEMSVTSKYFNNVFAQDNRTDKFTLDFNVIP